MMRHMFNAAYASTGLACFELKETSMPDQAAIKPDRDDDAGEKSASAKADGLVCGEFHYLCKEKQGARSPVMRHHGQ
jgi:hypothetical protein